MNAKLACLAVCLAVQACQSAKAPETRAAGAVRPQFDRHVGLPESKVRAIEGVPVSAKILPADQLRDELRRALPHRIAARGEFAVVKELYFRGPKYNRIYWLLKHQGNWTVISDVSFSPNTRF